MSLTLGGKELEAVSGSAARMPHNKRLERTRIDKVVGAEGRALASRARPRRCVGHQLAAQARRYASES